MPPTNPPHKTRRRVLQALGAAGVLGLAGCSGDDSASEETPPSDTPTATRTPTATQTPTPDQNSTPTPEPSDDGGETPTETSDQPVDRWGDIDPTGDVRYSDDPNWRMLGHDLGNTFHNPHASGPSSDPSVQWTLDTNSGAVDDAYASGTHHPLIVDGTVYATVRREAAGDGEGAERWEFVAADADTGETETVFSAEGRLWKPTIVDDTVYVCVNKTVGPGATIRAYDLPSGSERWRSNPSRGAGAVLHWPSIMRYVDGVVIATDNTRSRFEETEQVSQHYGFDATTGELLWARIGDGEWRPWSRFPLIADGLTFYPGTDTLRDIRTGDEQVTLPEPLDFPSLHDGELYGIPNEPRAFVSYDWKTLEKRWQIRPGRGISYGSIATFDDVLVCSTTDGFAGVDRETGESIWHARDVESSTGRMFRPSTEDTFYVVHRGGAVTALEPTTGDIEWQLRTEEMKLEFPVGCALADDLLISVGADGTLYAIS